MSFLKRWPLADFRSKLFSILVFASGSACGSSAPGTIGAALGQRTDHHVFVRSVPPGQGADRAGLVIDDEVVAIQGREVTEMTPDDIRRAVRGDVGSTLTVTIVRDGVRRDVKVTRTPLLAEKAEKK